MKFIERIRMQMILLFLLELIALVLVFVLGRYETGIALSFLFVISAIFIGWIIYTVERSKDIQDIEISRILGSEAKEAFEYGMVGIIVFNDTYEVTWVSDFLVQRGARIVGRKVTTFMERISDLFNGEVDVVQGEYNGHIYEVERKDEGTHVLFVRDVSELYSIKTKFEEDALVVGVVHLDNYMDISSFEEESKISMINTHIRQGVVEWAEKYDIMIRRLRSDRFILVLNERIYKQIVEDTFEVLNDTRRKAQELEVPITLSLSFARGTDNIKELDIMANDLLELAQSRGGDQVAVKYYGTDVKYYGGNSEAVSKRSRVRVRVMSQAIKEAILGSTQVFISGHKEMDFDCMGANLALSRMVQAYGKKAYIVSESGGVESYLQGAMNTYRNVLSERHAFISDEEACRIRKKSDLMVVVDYHNPAHCNAPMLLGKSERVIVVDHHRRTENYIRKPLLVYIETGASSSCELISEFFPYLISDLDICEEEATIMYLGILVDTNRFKMRTGFRTFEAAAQLKKLGVDPIEAEDFLKEDFSDFEAKTNVYKYGRIYRDSMIIACVDNDEVLSRTLMSMSADSLLAVKNIEAAFVVSHIADNEVAISARSKGRINVQRIMEVMHGGGHFSAAAMQKKGDNVRELDLELRAAINAYMDEEKERNDESNIA